MPHAHETTQSKGHEKTSHIRTHAPPLPAAAAGQVRVQSNVVRATVEHKLDAEAEFHRNYGREAGLDGAALVYFFGRRDAFGIVGRWRYVPSRARVNLIN
jgi:hypothetical protein